MLHEILAGAPNDQTLARALRHLAKWRSEVISNTLVARSGTTVLSGPFKGMDYSVRATEGSFPARLIGCYEASLSAVIEEIVVRNYPLVIDIGCAEGYYAVGLARRMPTTQVLARDASDRAQARCAVLARINSVADRVQIGGLFTHADFDICQSQNTVVICDIEGAERDLLDPERAPGLCHADILVETHAGGGEALVELLRRRFAPTHHLQVIGRVLDGAALPEWMEELGDLDRLLALWEWRSAPTPWIWMVRK